MGHSLYPYSFELCRISESYWQFPWLDRGLQVPCHSWEDGRVYLILVSMQTGQRSHHRIINDVACANYLISQKFIVPIYKMFIHYSFIHLFIHSFNNVFKNMLSCFSAPVVSLGHREKLLNTPIPCPHRACIGLEETDKMINSKVMPWRKIWNNEK